MKKLLFALALASTMLGCLNVENRRVQIRRNAVAPVASIITGTAVIGTHYNCKCYKHLVPDEIVLPPEEN